MIKSELVNRLADQYPHLYQRDVERVVNTILDEITEALGRGDRVELCCLLYTSPSPRDRTRSRMPSSA